MISAEGTLFSFPVLDPSGHLCLSSGADSYSPYNVLESMREYVYTPYREISKLIISLPTPHLNLIHFILISTTPLPPTVFISELTCRAWLIAETNKRRTLQKADVANAIAASDMFDFLIDIIPRDDGSGSATGSGAVPPPPGTGLGAGQNSGVVDEEEVDEDDDERVFTEFVRQEEIG
jgi:hypothetical protein